MPLGDLWVDWWIIFVVMALMASYVVGQAMNAVMGHLGFGAVGNMTILAAGFYAGLLAFSRMPLDQNAVELRFMVGVGCAFTALFILAFFKQMLSRS